MEGTCQRNGHAHGVNPQHLAALATYKPYDLSGVVTYDLVSRPSKVLHDELGHPTGADITLSDWLDSLPKQLAANDLRRVSDHLARAYKDGKTSEMIRKLESLEIKDGKITLKVRTKAQPPADLPAAKKEIRVDVVAPPKDGAPKVEPASAPKPAAAPKTASAWTR